MNDVHLMLEDHDDALCLRQVLLSLGIRHRENTRFARTKMWGCFRSAFRAIGSSLERLSLIDNKLVIEETVTL